MSADPAGFRPKRPPIPDFPPRRPGFFARVPPVIFTVILGLCALHPALRSLLRAEDLPMAAADLLGGILLPFWLFAIVALCMKIARRPSVIKEDLRVIPSRNGLFSATISGMVVAGIVQDFWPGGGLVLLGLSLLAHLALLLVFLGCFLAGDKAGRSIDPGWQLAFCGPLVAALYLADAGYIQGPLMLYWLCGIAGALIFLASLVSMVSRPPPAPLRPLLALHLTPLALLALTALALGRDEAAFALTAIALLLVPGGIMLAGWLTRSGFSPIWGSFAFPLVCLSQALTDQGGVVTGGIFLAVVFILVAVISWRILKLWPGGRLAAMTNAADSSAGKAAKA